VRVNAEEVRDYLAGIDWTRQFDPTTLRRANAYLNHDHLQSLSLERDRRGMIRLRALVRGSGEAIYEPWIEFREQGRGQLGLFGSCDCPVSEPCKHQALMLLYAQRFPSAQWPKDEPSAALPINASLPAEQIEALPEWLRSALAGQMAAQSTSNLPAWDFWFSRLAQMAPRPGVHQADDRRFGLILREEHGRLAVLPAFLRAGRGRMGGLVDPRPLELTEEGPSPAPKGGWEGDDAVALGALLASSGRAARRADPVVIDSAHAEAALSHLMRRHPVFWERGSTPIEAAPAQSVQLRWVDQPDGSQVLTLALDDPEPAALLLGHGLWYVQPATRSYGRVNGDPALVRAVAAAPPLQPEDVAEVQARLKRQNALPVAMPQPRRVRQTKAVPVPVLSMQVVTVEMEARHAQRAPLRLGVATLHFDYDGHRIAPGVFNERRREADGHDVTEVIRDSVRERRAEQRLADAGLRDALIWAHDMALRRIRFEPDQWLLQLGNYRTPASPEAWSTLLAELAADGFRIEYASDFPRDDVVEIDGWHAELAEMDEFGSPWFDVSLGIDVEGQRVDLLPILRRVLADPEFSLQRPADEPDDAAWRVRIDENRSVRLPLARLRAMLEPLLEWLTGSEDGLRLHRTQAATLRRIAEDTGVPWRGAERFRAQMERLRERPDAVQAPEGFRAQLRPYQRDGLAWLNFLSDAELGGILADDMGLGKTVQVLAHLLSEKQRGRLDLPALVVAPTSLVGNWRDEAARFAPDLRVLVLHGSGRAARYEAIGASDLVITTYPLLPRDRDSLCEQRFSLLILDEAQAIKNARSQAAQVVREIPARRRLAMTGTPLENHLGELWAQFDAVEPGLLGSESYFTRTYRTPIEKHGDADRQARLNRRVALLLLRRRKEDVLADLPPKTEIVRSLELQGSQRQLYETLRLAQHERVRESIAQRGLGQSGIVVLDALLKLRQACCDPRLVKLDAARRVRESAKLEALLDLIDGLIAESRRVLVFSQFTQMLALIGQALDKRKVPYLSLTGDTPAASRTDLVRSFQEGEIPVFLISLKAGGVGLNLTAADAVIHYDPWWNPAVESQATDRAHRIGQDKPVFVYKLICAGTVEEKIQAMQERKAELARAVLEGGGSSAALRFDEADLTELFAPI
jgi:superfamily II DNA or RNA helicase